MKISERMYIAAKNAPEDIDVYYYAQYLEQVELFELNNDRLFEYFRIAS